MQYLKHVAAKLAHSNTFTLCMVILQNFYYVCQHLFFIYQIMVFFTLIQVFK